MKTKWNDKKTEKSVVSPVTLIISAFSPVNDVRLTLTPELDVINPNTSLMLIDLGAGKNRLGGSAFYQVYNQLGNETPDISSAILKEFFIAISNLKLEKKILAYHDRSDGGLFVTLVEMMFATNCSFNINLDDSNHTIHSILFNEEIGAVIQIKNSDISYIQNIFDELNISAYIIGNPVINSKNIELKITTKNDEVFLTSRIELEKLWSNTSFNIQKI